METHMRLREAGIDISIATVKNYKTQIRSQSQTWISKLAKSRRGDYVACYHERIQEIEAIQKKLWEIIESQTANPRTKIEGCGKLLECTNSLAQFYDAMPVVNAMGDQINGKYGNLPTFSSSRNGFNSYGVQSGLGPPPDEPPSTSSE